VELRVNPSADARGEPNRWSHHQRESAVERPQGAQPPNTAGGNTTTGETPHGETYPATTPFPFAYFLLVLQLLAQYGCKTGAEIANEKEMEGVPR